ncbi:MAG: hypothetical protein ACYCSN_12595 [Acidobacteriaceae bacterium]
MGKPLWTFEGFVTDALNQVVQDWYWDELTIDERDLIRDRIAHLENVKGHLWKEPYFEDFGDIGEIKKKSTPRGALRIYGVRRGNIFLMLNGVLKKTKKDSIGTELARKRLKRLMNGQGSTHGFNFKEKSDRTN